MAPASDVSVPSLLPPSTASDVSVPSLLPLSTASPMFSSTLLESDPILPESFCEISFGKLTLSAKPEHPNPNSGGPSSQQANMGYVCPLKDSSDSPKLDKPNLNTGPKTLKSKEPTSQTIDGGHVPSPSSLVAAVPLDPLGLINQNVKDLLPRIRPSGGRRFGNWGDHRHQTYGGREVHNPTQLHHAPPRPIFRPLPPPTITTSTSMGFPNAPPPIYLSRPLSEINRSIQFINHPQLPFIMPPPRVSPQVDMLSIRKQVEYYFSKENLCRDEHLRMFMDDQGWVPIDVIIGFNQVKKLTEGLIDNIPCVLDALQSSVVVEVQGNKLRKRGDWDKWIIPSSYLADLRNRSLGGNAIGGL